MGKEITDREILNQMIERGVKNIIECYYPQFSFLSGYASNLLINFVDPYLEVLTNGGTFNTAVAKAYAKKEINDKIDDFIKTFEKERESETNNRSQTDE